MRTMARNARISSRLRAMTAPVPGVPEKGEKLAASLRVGEKLLSDRRDVRRLADQNLQDTGERLVAHDDGAHDFSRPDQEPEPALGAVVLDGQPVSALTPGVAVAARDGDEVVVFPRLADGPPGRRGHPAQARDVEGDSTTHPGLAAGHVFPP